jgi:PBP1b-binding outer membrane lipoprotein LpoB
MQEGSMKRITTIIAGLSALALAGCANHVPAPSYTQSRAIDQDIDATHVVGPTTISPAFTQKDTAPTLTPWRNEENIDSQRTEQTGQLPQ